jgi:hypothetical protein
MIISIILIGITFSLISYIPKEWGDKHIYKEIDPNDDNF